MQLFPKVNNPKPVVCNIMAVLVATFVCCSNENGTLLNLGGSSETTSANVAGIIYNSDGTPAVNAEVQIVPVEFNAFSDTGTSAVESTLTGENGEYSFSIKGRGFFNVHAQKNNASAFEDSVFVSSESSTKVDDTLKAPGSISGVARLESGGDNREIVILVMGTKTYSIPEDTSGSFKIDALAEGEYMLRFLTTNTDYGYIDTAVSVISGKNTTLEYEIMLPFMGVPEVESVNVAWDSVMMYASVSWPKGDTSRISGYYIYENPTWDSSAVFIASQNNEPLAIVPNTDSVYTADVLSLSGFATMVNYSIAAVGKDRSMGKLSVSNNRPVTTPLLALDTFTVDPIKQPSPTSYCCNESRFYIGGAGYLACYDYNEKKLIQYTDPINFNKTATDDIGNEYQPVYYSAIVVDAEGNVYAFENNQSGVTQTDSVKLIRFSPELQPAASLLVLKENGTADNPVVAEKLVATTDHILAIFGLIDGVNSKLIVKTMQTDLSEAGTDTIPEYCYSPYVLNDTIYLTNLIFDYNRIVSYDSKGNNVSEWNISALKEKYLPDVYKESGGYDQIAVFRLNSGEMMICFSLTGIVFIVDNELSLKSRFNVAKTNSSVNIIGCNRKDDIFVEFGKVNPTTSTIDKSIVKFRIK